jgi:hypothetical protein
MELVPESACVVHRLVAKDDALSLVPAAMAGAVSLGDDWLSIESRLVAPLFRGSAEPLVYAGTELQREDYAHLHLSRTFASLAYLPFYLKAEMAGVIEVVSFADPVGSVALDALKPVVRLAGPAILHAEESERQRQDLLDSVHRMSQLYDLEKSLNATLELDQVTSMVPEKTAAMLPCQAMHLWLFDGDVLRLMATHGVDATVENGMTQAAGQGYVADMAEEGEPLRIGATEDNAAEDERLVRRNRALEAVAETLRTLPIRNALLVPLMQDEAEVGVLEAVNKAVAQSDVALVRRGDHAAVKLDSYPQRSWHGAVDVVSPQAQAGEEGRTFAARVSLPNSNAILRAGMTGRAKIFIGYRPAGYVLLRKPALWLWQLLWNWIGW